MFKDKTLEKDIVNKYKGDNLINIFHLIQDKEGSITKENLLSLSKLLKIPLAQLQSSASFYSFFNFDKPSQNRIQICECLACDFNKAKDITDAITDVTNLKPGQSNDKFSFEKVQCIGCCDKAPAMLFNDNLVDKLTPDKIKEILNQC